MGELPGGSRSADPVLDWSESWTRSGFVRVVRRIYGLIVQDSLGTSIDNVNREVTETFMPIQVRDLKYHSHADNLGSAVL